MAAQDIVIIVANGKSLFGAELQSLCHSTTEGQYLVDGSNSYTAKSLCETLPPLCLPLFFANAAKGLLIIQNGSTTVYSFSCIGESYTLVINENSHFSNRFVIQQCLSTLLLITLYMWMGFYYRSRNKQVQSLGIAKNNNGQG
jgi:hypothetical protein